MLAAAILSCSFAPRASAATFYWDNDGSPTGNAFDGSNLGFTNLAGPGTWNLALSKWWDGALTDGLWVNAGTSVAIFNGTSGTVTLGTGITANMLSFVSDGYVITGNTLTLAGATPTVQVGLGKTATISSQVAGVGVDGLTVTGGGSLRLTNATNSYTGATTINGATLQSANSGALSTTGSVTVNNAGSMLAVNYGGVSDYTEGQVVTLLGKTTFGSTDTAFGFDTTNAVGAVTYGTALSMGAGITKLGTGTLNLSVANTFSGSTTVKGGTLKLSNSLALQNSAIDTSGAGVIDLSGVTTPTFGGLTGSKNLASVITTGYGSVTALTLKPGTGVTNTYSGVLTTGAAGMSVIKSGAGTQILAGANTYGGPTSVNAGTLKAGFPSVPGVSGAFGNNSAVTLANIASATLDITDVATQIGSLTGGGPAGGTVVIANTILTVGGDNTSPAAFAGVISGLTGSVFKIGTGKLTLSGANTYNGVTTIIGGTLQSANAGALANTSSVNVDGSGAVLAVNYGGPSDYNLAQVGTLLGITAFHNTSSALGFDTTNAVGAATYSNPLTMAAGFTKLGTGTLILSAANTFSGSTTLSGGTLQLNNNLALQNSALDTSGVGVIALSGATAPTFGGLIGSKNLASVITSGYGAMTGLTLNPGAGFTNAYSGNIVNGAAGMTLTMSGAGTQILSGTNSYTGGTALNAGTLVAGNAAALGTVGNISFGGGILQYTPNSAGTNFGSRIKSSSAAISLDTKSQEVTLAGAIDASNTGGLTKLGFGTLRLSPSNAYTGVTTIVNGTIIVSNNGDLGGPSNPTDHGNRVVVTTYPNPFFTTRGYASGSLVLEGGYTSGVNLFREISVGGYGPISDRSSALISVGENQLSGLVNTNVGLSTNGLVNTRIVSTFGTMKFTGTIDIGGQLPTNLSNLMTMGGFNSGGPGQYEISGVLKGFGILEKSGAGTLILNPSDTSAFTGSLRLNSSFTGTQGTVRISTSTALGIRGTGGGSPPPAGVTTQSVLDFNSGTLEIRTDAPNFTSTNIYARGNTNNLFVDHGVTGLGINGLVEMGNFYSDNTTFQVSGRNGWNTMLHGSGVTTGGLVAMDWTWNGGANATINNLSSGTLTLDFIVQHISEATQRTFTVGGNGDTVINGNVQVNGTSSPSITSTGSGQLTMAYTGPAATPSTGVTTINGGTLSFSTIDALPTGTINIGNATTGAGTLTYTGGTQTIPNVINLNTTSAPVYINASGTGPLTLTGSFGAVTGSKVVTLGGTNTGDNTITSVLPSAGGTLSLQKIGAGTWVLNPTSSNQFTGSTTISGGTLKLQERSSNFSILANTGAVIFTTHNFTNAAGGTLQYLGNPTSASTETVGALTISTGGSAVSVSNTSGSATLTFSTLGTRTIGGTMDFQPANLPSANGSIKFTIAAGANGILGGWATFGGTEFAASVVVNGGTLAALTGQAVLPTSGSVSTTNYQVTATPGGSIAAESINSLKIKGSPTITLAGLLTITSGGVLFDNSTGAATITGNQIGANGSEVIFTVNGSAPANALTVNSLVSGSTGQLTKAGSGTLVLTGANNFQGNVHINGGTVKLSGASAQLGSSQAGGTVLNLRQGATLDLNGAGVSALLYTGAVGGINSIQIGALLGAGVVTNSSATPSALIIGNGTTTNASGLFSGTLQNGTGVLTVVKRGTGTLSLTGPNSYTGATIITSGTLAVTSLANGGLPSSIGASTFAAANLVFDGGTLQYTGSNSTIVQATQTPSVSTNRLFTLSGNGTIDSSGQYGNNVLAGGVRNDAALVFSNTGDVAFTGPGNRLLTLQGNSIGDNQMRVHLVDNIAGSGTLAVTASNTGLWILNPATSNTYSGATTISGGTLQVLDESSNPKGISVSSNLVFSGGVLQTSGTFTRVPGNGANQVRWSFGSASGGFSASSSKLVVNMGPGSVLQFGLAPFTTGALILSSTTALSEVEFANGLDLNNGVRTIQVDDNLNTASDFATVSGVISNSTGTGSLNKTGNGILQLVGANTYNGTTNLTSGTLVVTSFGDSATSLPSSVGTSVGANSIGQAVTIGNGGGGAAILVYAGKGETTDRMIRINTTTGSDQIFADGSGALVLTNVVNNMANGNKTLFLRGSNTQANQITSGLSDNGGILNITVDGGATWVLAGANSFSGAVNVNAGALGIGSNGAIGNGRLILNNGSTFAYGADRTIANTVQHANNTTTAFIGDYSLNFTGTLELLATANPVIMTNNITSEKLLSFNDVTANLLTGTSTWTINGTGNARINGAISNSVGTLNVTFSPVVTTSTLTLAGSSTYNGATVISGGRLILAGGGDNRLPVSTPLTLGAGLVSGVLQLGDAAGPSNQTLTTLIVGGGTMNAVVGGNSAVSTLTMNILTDQDLLFALGGGVDFAGNHTDPPEYYNLKLVKTGPGTLNILQTNYHTGGTDVGTLGGSDGGAIKLTGLLATLGDPFAPAGPLNVYGGTADLGSNGATVSDLNLGGGAAGSTARVIEGGALEVKGSITYNATNNPNPATISGDITGAGGLDLHPFGASTTIAVGSSTAGSGGALAPDLTITSTITGIKPIHKTGPGTLRLVANTVTPSSWQSSFFVDAGTLILDGSTQRGTLGDNTTPNPVFATATAITVGSGSTGARLNFGASDGETTTFQKLTVNSNSTLVFNLGAVNQYATPGFPLDWFSPVSIRSDTLILTDTDPLTLGTGLKIDINALSGFGAGRYVLIDAATTSDLSVPFTLGAKPGGFNYALRSSYTGGIYDLYLDVSALSQLFYWKGGRDSQWTSQDGTTGASNWVNAATGGTVINGLPGLVNDVFFSATSPSNSANTVVGINMGVKSLTITDAAVLTIKGNNGNVLSIADGISIGASVGSVALGSSSAAEALFLGVVNNQSWTNGGTGTLTVWNQIFSQGTTGAQILTFDGSGSTTLRGNIINGGLGGSLAITKTNNSSTLSLLNPGNTYTGGTKISGGTLEFASGALPGTGTVEFIGDATLRWLSGNADDVSNRLKIGNTFTATLDVGSNNVIFATTLHNPTPTSGTLKKIGAGTLTLNADNISTGGYTGGTIITNGTLEFVTSGIPNSGNLTFAGDATLKWGTLLNAVNSDDVTTKTIANPGKLIVSSGTATFNTNGNDVTFNSPFENSGAFTKAGSGTLTLAVDNTTGGNSFTGAINVKGGTLEFVTNALPGTGNITFTGNSTLRWSAGNTTDISSRLNINSGTTASIDTNGNNVSFVSPIQATGSSNGNLTKTGVGTLTITATSPNFTGVTQVDAGTLVVSGSLSGTTSLNVASGATFQLAGSGNRIKDTATVMMGTSGATAPAILLKNNSAEAMGVFTLVGNSVIDFNEAHGGTPLQFANSSGSLWNGTLSINNWTGTLVTGGGADQLFFGTNALGLTAGQLSLINFYSDNGVTFLGTAAFAAPVTGEIVPVPEPAGLVSLLGGAGLLLGLRRRQRNSQAAA